MEAEKKKPILFGLVVVCFAVAGGIAYFTMGGGTEGADSLKPGVTIWVKCANPNCGAEYQMEQKAYYKESEKARRVSCKQCGEPTLLSALKCEKCGIVFIPGSVRNDVSDRCPECGYSKTEGTTKPVK